MPTRIGIWDKSTNSKDSCLLLYLLNFLSHLCYYTKHPLRLVTYLCVSAGFSRVLGIYLVLSDEINK